MAKSEIRYCEGELLISIKEFKNILSYSEISEEIRSGYVLNGICFFAHLIEKENVIGIVINTNKKKYHLHINDCINKDTFIEITNLMKLAANRYKRLKQHKYKETLKLNDTFKTMII